MHTEVKNRFEYLISEMESRDECRNTKERVQFDYFNPNGAWPRHTRIMDRARAAVERGELKGGFLLAYSGEYHLKRLSQLSMRKSNPSTFESTYSGDALRAETDRAIERALQEYGVDLTREDS